LRHCGGPDDLYFTQTHPNPSRLPNARGPGAQHYAKYWDPGQMIEFIDSNYPNANLSDSQDDNDRICILMDALHDRILMEDQK